MPFLFVSGTISEASTFQSLRRGAIDYVNKHQLEMLGPALLRAVIEARNQGNLLQSEERYRLLLEGFRDSLLLLAPPQWRCQEANQACLQPLGAKARDQLHGVSLTEPSPESQPDGSASAPSIQSRLELGLPKGHYQFEWQFKRLQGRNFPAEIELLQLDIGGNTMQLATLQDISERKPSNRKLI